jgi:hypothetical protein
MAKSEPELQNRIVGIVGRKGTGKSTELAEILSYVDRVLIFDAMGEHSFIPNKLFSVDELREFLKWTKNKKQWAATFIPGEEIEEDIEGVSKIVFDRGDLTFAIEEVPLICSPGHLPKKLGKLIRTGRHRKIDIYWTAQRAGEVSRTMTSLTDEFILFSQTEPRDLDAISSRCGADVADLVSRLNGHDHVVWDVKSRRLVDRAAVHGIAAAPAAAAP